MNKITAFNLSSRDAIEQRTSTGWLMKWHIDNFWIKAPGYLIDYTWDSVAEVIAYNIAKDLNIQNCSEYRLCIINLDNKIRLIGCISKDYKKLGFTELTIQKMIDMHIISKTNYYDYVGYNELIIEIKNKFKLNIRKYLDDTLLLDAIILNTDRNFWNLSIAVDNKLNGQILPIYDFGNSLGLSDGKYGDFYEDIMYYNGIQARPFNYSFENQIKYIRNNREYSGKLINTNNILRLLYNNFTIDNNKYGVYNTLRLEQLNYTKQVIEKRYKNIILSKAWKDINNSMI